jgi:hypothetical protein
MHYLKRYPSLMAFSVIFILMLVPSMFTPMQSDDYSYALMGASVKDHYSHYMHWSGRLVADYISGTLLAYLPHWLYEIINAAGVSSLILAISQLPKYIVDSDDSKSSFLGTIIIFLLYWIANPNLGQTSFWIVGSANYMWTNLFICIFFISLFSVLRAKSSARHYVMIASLGLIAGCSNENTAIVTILITAFAIFIEKDGNRKLLITGLVSLAVGAVILLLAPGNAVRATRFQSWYSKSFRDRFDIHFYERLPDLMGSFWQVYIAIIVLLIAGTVGKHIKDKTKVYSMLFFAGAIAANCAFLFAPGIPGRSNNGALILTLISMSFIVSSSIRHSSWQNKTAMASILLMCLFYFIPSYLFLTNTWIVGDKQAQIRNEIIKDNLDNGVKVFNIPDFEFTKLSKKVDAFDLYHSFAFAKYHGADKIGLYKVGFDYSPAYFSKPLDINHSLKNSLFITSIFFGDDGYGFDPQIIFEFNEPLFPTLSNGEIFTAHVISKSGKRINCDTGTNPVDINGRFLYAKKLQGVSRSEISEIIIGVYNTKTKMTSNVKHIELR